MAPGDMARRTSARGLRRRQLLMEAAGDVLREHGFAAVSHRAVAQQAELPLSATTYYFRSLEDLLEGAVRQLADGWLVNADAVVADLSPELDDSQALAEALIRVATLGLAGGTATDSRTLLSLYERYLEAARHPRIRPVIAEYDERIEALLADVLRRRPTAGDTKRTARLVLAVIDGALLRALAEGLPVSSATTAVEQLLNALSPVEVAKPAPVKAAETVGGSDHHVD